MLRHSWKRFVRLLSGALVVGGCNEYSLKFMPPRDAGADAAAVDVDAGNPPPFDAGACAPAKDPPDWPTDAEACWRRTAWSWLKNCPVEQAEHPELAVPSLVWGPCPDGSAPGCENFIVTWPSSAPPRTPMAVLPTAEGYRVVSYQRWVDLETRVAFYDEMGRPTTVHRVKDPCYLMTPILTPSRAWFGTLTIGPATYAVSAHDQMANPFIANLDDGSQRQSGDDELLALWLLDGSSNLIYDRVSNQSFKLQGGAIDSGSGYSEPSVINGTVLVRYYPAFQKPEGWIWTRTKKVAEPLVQPAPNIIADFRSDGQTLIWVQTPPIPVQGPVGYPPGDLWTSPFVTSKAELQPKKLRPVPVVGHAIAGSGYYAFHSPDKHIHIYRLADGQHWDFALSPGMGPMFRMSFIDDKYIFFVTWAGSYRQPLNTLGPGDPPP